MKYVFAHLLVIFFTFPLIAKLIPPNRFYGIRIPMAYDSEDLWYAINRFGGLIFLVFAIISLLITLMLLKIKPNDWELYSVLTYTGYLISVIIILLRWMKNWC